LKSGTSNLQLLATNNVDPNFKLLVSPISFYNKNVPNLTDENGALLSPEKVLEKAILDELMEYLRWGREVNYPEGNENQGVFYAYDINTGAPILNADGTIQRQIVDLSQVSFKVILDRGQSTQLNLPTTQVEGQTNQDNQAFLPLPIEAGSSGITSKFNVFINPEIPTEIIFVGKYPPTQDGNGAMILPTLGTGFFYFSVLPETNDSTFNQQNLLVDQPGINMAGYESSTADLERSLNSSSYRMFYLDVATD